MALEDGLDDSASESLLVSIDTITSFIPEVFSWEDSSSSEGMRNEMRVKVKKKKRTTAKHPSEGKRSGSQVMLSRDTHIEDFAHILKL